MSFKVTVSVCVKEVQGPFSLSFYSSPSVICFFLSIPLSTYFWLSLSISFRPSIYFLLIISLSFFLFPPASSSLSCRLSFYIPFSLSFLFNCLAVSVSNSPSVRVSLSALLPVLSVILFAAGYIWWCWVGGEGGYYSGGLFSTSLVGLRCAGGAPGSPSQNRGAELHRNCCSKEHLTERKTLNDKELFVRRAF